MLSFRTGSCRIIDFSNTYASQNIMYPIKIKAGAISHLTDARYFAARDVDWLGFGLDATDAQAITNRQVAAIREWVDGPDICGEFGLAPAEDILAIATSLSLDAIQVDQFFPLHELALLSASTATVFVEWVVSADDETAAIATWLKNSSPYVDFFIINYAKGGVTTADIINGKPFPINQLAAWASLYPILIETSGDGTIAMQLWEQTGIYGFHIRGGSEERVGYKNFDELDEWFDAWDTYDAAVSSPK